MCHNRMKYLHNIIFLHVMSNHQNLRLNIKETEYLNFLKLGTKLLKRKLRIKIAHIIKVRLNLSYF
jgi:hypothetical protein